MTDSPDGNTYENPMFSQLYDFTIKRLGRQNLDLELLKFCAKRFGHPILEMGCGVGTKLFPLAKMGYTVTGIDNSPQMLKVFQQKLSNLEPEVQKKVKPEPIEDDMIDPRDPRITSLKFSLIIFSGSQFMYLKDDEQRLKCLQNSHHLLNNDGVIVISNGKLKERPEYDWTEYPGQPEDEWIVQARGYWLKGAYQEEFKLIPQFRERQEHLFGWRYYPIEDEHMKHLIEKSSLQCLPLPSNLPTRPTANVYLLRQ